MGEVRKDRLGEAVAEADATGIDEELWSLGGSSTSDLRPDSVLEGAGLSFCKE